MLIVSKYIYILFHLPSFLSLLVTSSFILSFPTYSYRSSRFPTNNILTLNALPQQQQQPLCIKKKKNMSSSLKPYIEVLIEGSRHLTSEETEKAFSCILSGSDDVQVGSLLTLLRARNETPEEIAGMVRAMNSACNAVHLPGMKLLDIVGTGGDGADTINISTASVVLAAACGCTVAKVCFRCFVLVFYLTT